MALSANTLFHFTSSLDILISILTRDFIPRYSLENYNVLMPKINNRKGLEVGIPMVSFCDIPLSKVSQHIDIYGRYGIGLEKNWGLRNGISPVIYANKKTKLSSTMREMAILILSNELDVPTRLQKRLSVLFGFIKPYEGIFKRNKRLIRKYRFYDEREWRYIPRTLPRGFILGMPKEDFENTEILNRANMFLFSGRRLMFSVNDIRYIIVSKEREIQEIIDVLSHDTHQDKFPKKNLPILASKIITCERIFEDL